jgi:hypothetical protein
VVFAKLASRGFEFFSGMTRAKGIIVMDYDVGDMNADAKLYPFVQRYGGVFLDHAALDFKGAQPSADYGSVGCV